VSSTILLGEHGRYQIKSGRLAGTFVARAFPKPPTQARGMIAEATGATEEEAIAALQGVLDSRESRRVGERRLASETGLFVPSVEEYAEAMRHIALTPSQCAMLTALSLSGDNGMSDPAMAYASGLKSQASANKSFAAAGKLIGKYLFLDTASTASPADGDGTALLGYRKEPENEGALGNRVLHAEVREAVWQTL